MTVASAPSASAWHDRLRDVPDLELLLPGDIGFDAAHAAWNPVHVHDPVAIAIPGTVAAIGATVDAAREAGVPVAVQVTGHGPTRAARGALLVSLSRLDQVHVLPEAKRAVVEGGATWGVVLDAVTPHGLAPLLGSSPGVGAVGYTLGGGLGWLARRYGAAADSVVAFELVTADGRLVRVTAEEEPELFWALRGAGAGHLGIVASMEIELYPVTQLYAGSLFYPASQAAAVLRRWRDWLPGVPEALTSAVALMNFPPIEDVPEPFRGGSFAIVRGAFDGPTADGERLLSYWRDWQAPAIDAFGPLPFARVAEISQDPVDPVPNEGVGVWLRDLSDATIQTLTEAMFATAPPALLMTELRHAEGAVARGGAVPSAVGNRDGRVLLQLVGVAPTPELAAAVRAEIERVRAAIAADLTGGLYLNYAEGDERRYGVVAGIGTAAAERLAALKARVDPSGLFDYGLDATAGGPPTVRPELVEPS